MEKWFKNLGDRVVTGINYIGQISILCAQTLFWITVPPFKRERILEQSKRIGIDSFFIVSIVALFIGMILALQTAYQMTKLSSEIYIANLVSVSLTRELGPILTALIVAGRVGAAITAEIGTMKVTEQVDALETLATNPIKYLVVPRFLSLVIMLPILTIFADFIGIIGGYIICVYKLYIPSALYIQNTFDALVIKDVLTGLFKSIFFGMIIALVGCYEGLRAQGGAEGVGKATTISVVTSFILIIATDCFFTALFYFVLEK
ncbi:MAG: ABC transporter permease [Candidatus Omnitrophica bacterium]|nr:ABC transporter permease [Candidatus Omnitrophota bacterium]